MKTPELAVKMRAELKRVGKNRSGEGRLAEECVWWWGLVIL